MVYPQMVGEDYPLFYKWKDETDFLNVIENVLDNPKLHKKAIKHLEPIMKKMLWNKRVRSWMDWKSFFNPNSFPMVGEGSSGYDKMLKIIRNHNHHSIHFRNDT